MHLPYKLLAMGTLAVCTSSCVTEFANPLLNNDLTYMAKPSVSDSVKWGTYVAGNIFLSDGFNPFDFNTHLEANAHQSYTFPFGSIALGGFGYAGRYKLNIDTTDYYAPITQYGGNYFYYGGGVRGSFNFTIPGERIDFRFLGIDAAWSKEWGEYLELRKTVEYLPYVLSVTDDELFTLAVTQEICFKRDSETQIAFKWFYGKALKGNLNYTESYENAIFNFFGINAYYSHYRMIGFFQSTLLENWGAKIGLGYRLY